MITGRWAPWSRNSSSFLSGLPSTTIRSAKAPGSTMPSLPSLAQDLGADGGGLPDDLDRLQHLGAEDELAALLDLELAQKVGAVADLHAGRLADLERAQRAVEHDVVLGQHVGGHAELGGALLHR